LQNFVSHKNFGLVILKVGKLNCSLNLKKNNDFKPEEVFRENKFGKLVIVLQHRCLYLFKLLPIPK